MCIGLIPELFFCCDFLIICVRSDACSRSPSVQSERWEQGLCVGFFQKPNTFFTLDTRLVALATAQSYEQFLFGTDTMILYSSCAFSVQPAQNNHVLLHSLSPGNCTIRRHVPAMQSFQWCLTSQGSKIVINLILWIQTKWNVQELHVHFEYEVTSFILFNPDGWREPVQSTASPVRSSWVTSEAWVSWLRVYFVVCWRGEFCTGFFVFQCMECSPTGAETTQFAFITLTQKDHIGLSAKSGRGGKAHVTCIVSAGYSVAIKSCLFSSTQIKKRACDMFIKQQGSHYCTPHSLSQCSYIAACTCSLGTSGLIVALLSVRQFILFWLLPSAGVPRVCSPKVAHRYQSALRLPGLFVKGFKLQKICVLSNVRWRLNRNVRNPWFICCSVFLQRTFQTWLYLGCIIHDYTLLHIYMSFMLNHEDSECTNCVFFLMVDINYCCGLDTLFWGDF